MGKTAKIKELIKQTSLEVIRLGNKRYRVGYCCQCGECCKSINMDTKGTKEAIRWLKLHGVRVSVIGDIKKDPREEAREFTLSISLPCQCEKLRQIADNKYTCTIYEDRPVICEYYPKQYTGYKTCTYMFLDDEELQKLAADYTEYWRKEHGQEKAIKISN